MSDRSLLDATSAKADLGQTLLDQLISRSDPFLASVSGIKDSVLGMLGLYSSAVLVLATFLVLYHVIHAVVDAAQSGKPFRHLHPVWGPVRLITAIVLLVPLPGLSGLNTGQVVVVKLAGWGSNLASEAWARVARDPEILKPMIAEPLVPPAAALVRGLVLRDACLLLTNEMAAEEKQALEKENAEGGSARTPTLQPVTALASVPNGDGSTTTPYGWAERPYFCGSVTVYAPVAGEPEFFRQIKEAHLKGLDMMQRETPDLAVQMRGLVNGDALASISGTAQLANDYEARIRDTIRTAMETRLDGALGLENASDKAWGWVGAATALDQVLRFNVRLIALASSFPEVDPPDLFLAPPAGSSRAAGDARVYLTLRKIELLWGRVPAVSPFSAAGLGGLSMALGQSIATSQSAIGAGRTGQQLRSARDLLRLDDHDWRRLAQRPPLAGLAELGMYLSGKAVMLLSGAGILNATGSVAGPMVGVLTFLGGLGFLISLVLLLFTPLIPFVRFVLGVAAWLLALFEAVVAVPLVALMHLKADEEGLAGRSAALCYILVLQAALRPVLIVLGLLGGLIIFLIMLALLNQMFALILSGLTGAGQIGSLWFVASSLVYAVLALAIANACFKLVDWLPQRTLTWLSGWVERPMPTA